MTDTPPKPERRRWRWAAGIVLGAVACVAASIDVVPNVALTKATMYVLEQRVQKCVALGLEIPQDLKDLPIVEGKLTDVTDAWVHRITLLSQGEDAVLLSLGADGRPGGEGDAADIERSFPFRRGNQ